MEPTRRTILQAGALLVSGGTLAGCRSTTGPDEEGEALRIAGYPVDRVRALATGEVRIEGYRHRFEKAAIYELNAVAMGGDQRWEIQEIGLHPYMLATADKGLADYTLIPVFPLRAFRHKSMFVRADGDVSKPEDLRGRRVCTAGYSQSSLTWIRGILQHEYGVHPQEMKWVLARRSSEGGVSKNEARVPEGVESTWGPAGKDESQLLLEGAVDAVLSAKEPQAFIEGDPRVRRLFPNARRVERAYFERTGVFPIMHAVALRKDVVVRDPSLPLSAYEAYTQAKDRNYAQMRDVGWAMTALPWFAQELEETRALMGNDFYAYGIRANRNSLEALFRYSHEQGLCSRVLTVEELFHPSTLGT
jgi:4,5-dihydroxyphthalate decarboxylase